jgi:hypothetical protein
VKAIDAVSRRHEWSVSAAYINPVSSRSQHCNDFIAVAILCEAGRIRTGDRAGRLFNAAERNNSAHVTQCLLVLGLNEAEAIQARADNPEEGLNVTYPGPRVDRYEPFHALVIVIVTLAAVALSRLCKPLRRGERLRPGSALVLGVVRR